MPAVQYDYEYDYMKTRTSKKAQQNAVSNSRAAEISRAKAKNKASIRAVMMDDDIGVDKRKVSTNKVKNNNRTKSNSQNHKPAEMSLKKAELVGKKKIDAKARAEKRASSIRTFAYCVFAFSIVFLIIYRSSVINESFLELNGIKGNLENVNAVNAQIESEIQTQTDLSSIETYAKYQLGMQKPKASQIQRVTIAKEDKISTPVILNEEESSFWDDLLNDFMNILD